MKWCAASRPERRREVEPEPVDLHVVRPVAQRIQDQPGGGIRRRVDRIAAPRDVDVHAVVLLAVVRPVVDAAQARARTADAFLGGVVVDDVEDDLEARLVEQLHHALELAQHRLGTLAAVLLGRVGAVRGEEVEGVVAPVVREAVLQQSRLGREGVYRQQLDARDAEREEVLDHRGVCETGVGSVQRRRDQRMPLRHALQMALVDDRAVHRHRGLARRLPSRRIRR